MEINEKEMNPEKGTLDLQLDFENFSMLARDNDVN